ncbi:hypothetical protein BaRGS_00031209 [Batillaria attramentaria]|uniref:Uncharacterized protein n=1 Tax=Batillaria attramentaria TaxID=370345 RepID=A0ABD0JS96_9CAEN
MGDISRYQHVLCERSSPALFLREMATSLKCDICGNTKLSAHTLSKVPYTRQRPHNTRDAQQDTTPAGQGLEDVLRAHNLIRHKSPRHGGNATDRSDMRLRKESEAEIGETSELEQ